MLRLPGICVLVLAAFALAVGAVGCGRLAPAGGERTPAPAPDFSFTTLEGDGVGLSQLKGDPVTVVFLASWCPSCAHVASQLEQIYQRHRSDGLQVIGISPRDTEEALKKKAADLKLTFPIGINEQAALSYGVRAIPATVFIDREGRLVSSITGIAPADQFEAQVKRIL